MAAMTLHETRTTVARGLALAALLLSMTAAADAEIFRCPQPDGSVAFQGMPCPDEAAATVDDEAASEASAEAIADNDSGDEFLDEDAFVNPFDLPAGAQETSTESPAAELPAADLPEALSADRSACEETTRRAIDAIDAELDADTTDGDAKSRMDELLALTQQLRACKTL